MSLPRGSLRLLHSAHSTRRSYSFFSSKSGAGRYISATKPPKVDSTATTSSTSSTAPGAETDASSSGASSLLEQDGRAGPGPAEPPKQERRERLASIALDSARPDLSHADVRLNAFFARDRPLFLLSQPTSALFTPAPPNWDPVPVPARAKTPSRVWYSHNAHFDAPQLLEDPPEATPETDAEAARLLGRSLVLSRVGAWADWERVLAQMGDEASGVALDSTKRKKRKKMKKHKLVKRKRVSVFQFSR